MHRGSQASVIGRHRGLAPVEAKRMRFPLSSNKKNKRVDQSVSPYFFSI